MMTEKEVKEIIADCYSSDDDETIEKLQNAFWQLCQENQQDLADCGCSYCGSDFFYTNKGRLSTIDWNCFFGENDQLICEECFVDENSIYCDFCETKHYINDDDLLEEDKYLIVLCLQENVNIPTGLYKVKDKNKDLFSMVMFSSMVRINENNVELICEIPFESSPFYEEYCEITQCKEFIKELKSKFQP